MFQKIIKLEDGFMGTSDLSSSWVEVLGNLASKLASGRKVLVL